VASASAPDQRLADLASLTEPALGYLSLEEMLAELLERIRAGLEADTAAVLLVDEERRVLVARAARGIEEEVREGMQVPLGRGFAGRVAVERRPIMIEDLEKGELVNPLLRQKGIRSLLGVPLLVEGRALGVLHVGTVTSRRFSVDDTRLLQLAADRAALAIENARLSEQRAVTEIMQRALLPDALAQIPGLRFSAKYLPAGSAVKIGGDWYDAFPLTDGRIALVIGDVVGRGMMAASLMSEIRTAMRAYLLEGHDAASVMSLVNDLLVSLGRNRSATAAILALDLEAHELSAVSAGHPPALQIGPDGHPQLLDGVQGPPLGVASAHRYETERLPFPPRSALLLYTDGLIERRSEPIDEGFERLVNAAAEAFGREELTLADRVYRALAPGLTPEDDVALLAVESIALGPRLDLHLEATPRVLAGLRRAIGRWLRANGAPDADTFDITVAASEAASNAIEHAYGPREATFDVECEWDAQDAAVTVTVRDRGSWQEPRHDDGRGLMMMDKFMDSVEIERSGRGTTVTLTKQVRAPA
jgi:serine phosphatase RsbU (regulator of sigma subunit)/anti-sigma regulatory factor (Ser/Thr protein kinase)